MTIFTYEYLEKNGRCGNQLWQIAATLGFAHANGGTALFRPDWEYRKYFSVPDKYFDHAPYRDECGLYTQEVCDGGTEYFQELRHFAEIEDVVREYFTPSDLTLEQMDKDPQYSEILHGASEIPSCSIHVRRGDYIKYPNHFPLPTPLYYQNAVEMVLDESPGTHFFVFSDDIEWCKDHFGTKKMTFVTGIPRPVEVIDRKGEPEDQYDLIAMTVMDRHIIANSTFSWWGAFLSDDKRVIYPSQWYGNHPLVRNIPWDRMIPDSWIGIGV